MLLLLLIWFNVEFTEVVPTIPPRPSALLLVWLNVELTEVVPTIPPRPSALLLVWLNVELTEVVPTMCLALFLYTTSVKPMLSQSTNERKAR